MADMSQDEKRAAGRKKLQKYQQHKSGGSSKNAKKKILGSDEHNDEPYSFFTGFAESQGGEAIDYIIPHSAQIIGSKDSDTSHHSSDELIDKDPCLESECNVNFHDVPHSLNENGSKLSVDRNSAEKSIPLSANIFSNFHSPAKSNLSDFFDNIKFPHDHGSGNVPAPLTHEYIPTNVAFECYDQDPLRQSEVSDHDINSVDLYSDVKKVDFEYHAPQNELLPFSETTYKEVNCDKHDQDFKVEEQQFDKQINLASSAENLRQLSLELNGLIDNPTSASVTHSSQMERRNQELAALYASEKEKCERLNLQMTDMKSQVSQLRAELCQQQTDTKIKMQQELSPLQEQLQLHVKTVGILVGEKTELEAALSKSQQTAKQKAVEVEELQGRLKASRHRVADLERELASVNLTNKQLESTVQQQSKDLLRIKLEKEMLSEDCEEANEAASEARRNLDVCSAEIVRLKQELQEKVSQLDLTQLRVQQLSLSDSSDVEKQLAFLHQQKVELERQVTELQQTIQTVGSERDQANNQYQEYLHNVNSHLKNMADKLAAATAENEQLTNREQGLVKHLSELEKQLQQQQHNRAKDSPQHLADIERLQKVEKNFTILQDEKEKISINFDCQVQENKSLKDQLEIYCSRIEELEILVESLKSDQPDHQKLLAAMESDKVAAARAVEQNQKLKEQLEELQEGFIQMTNNKLDLTEQLEKEQLLCKELGERLAQQELEISELRTQVMEQMRRDNQSSNTEEEADGNQTQRNIIQSLENDVNQYKKQCESLQAENEELQMKLSQSPTLNTLNEGSQKDNIIENLKTSVCQLTMERDQLLLHHSQIKPIAINKGTDTPDSNFSNQDVDVKEYSNLKEAMEKLQARFLKTMEEIAELSDEKQRLEHLVLQLQGETETIGEYITLYQKQRSILKQRAQEKDEQLARLARDREEVKVKLNELNRLIGQLVAENGSRVISSSFNSPIEKSMGEVLPESDVLTNGDVKTTKILDSVADQEHSKAHSLVQPGQTADKIIALLSEIETSTLVEPRNVESFHPCPWCSGRLITV